MEGLPTDLLAEAARNDPNVGRQLDRYRVLEKIGEGGMGVVYAVEHVLLRKRMAMKILHPAVSADPELSARFHNEAIAASRIGHENIVTVTDFGWSEDGRAYLVMEELRGRSLARVLAADRSLSAVRAAAVGIQVARALAAAHAMGIVHRDLKPDNVMVLPGPPERVKVLDFGISKVGPSDLRITRAGAILGTPEYMSPEQASGLPIDRRADIYALGVVLYEMLAGRPPFLHADPLQVLLLHRSEPPPPILDFNRRARVPEELLALVRRMLEKDPDRRPQQMTDCAAALRRAIVGPDGDAVDLPRCEAAVPLPPPAGSALFDDPRPLRLLTADLRPLSLTPPEAFVASRLQGCPLTAAQLVQVSGLPRVRTMEILVRLIAERVVVRGPAPA